MVESDQAIKDAIISKLKRDARIEAADVEVEVEYGNVTLFGAVNDSLAQKAAESDAWSVEGVTAVNNMLVVKPEAIGAVSDEEIEVKAKKAIAADLEIDAKKISLECDNGVVTITGNVDNFWKKYQVENAVYALDGVTNVNNYLAIVPSNKQIDEEIADNVVKNLSERAILNLDEITVTVVDGIVHLSGRVRDEYVLNIAGEIALDTEGVIDVVNDLSVGYET